jgi:hypothetical protein
MDIVLLLSLQQQARKRADSINSIGTQFINEAKCNKFQQRDIAGNKTLFSRESKKAGGKR